MTSNERTHPNITQMNSQKFHRIISCWMNRHPTKNEYPKINNAIEILPSCGWKFTLLQEVRKDVQAKKNQKKTDHDAQMPQE